LQVSVSGALVPLVAWDAGNHGVGLWALESGPKARLRPLGCASLKQRAAQHSGMVASD
jgi:hypothetical protein